ncbi:Protein of unknown function [Propionibacterium freudenreichii]|nr:Protein of unknown function [Propionibacterium freudenreichii]CEI32363.1 Protein of unknown function [Propionibacterium freudenreichii]
MTGQPGSP